ncbi:hypothetical protein [Phenylobacterium sp.]|uniref:hypothetical protein n=1 Tax=Phenylobacterium sp. TaxID=1871053 RepID=UPI0025E055E1|nr:hypothetical protein [Phenylobacterium sp.]MBX3483889.1 hypothetical protein [Phenylobacterium sp.]
MHEPRKVSKAELRKLNAAPGVQHSGLVGLLLGVGLLVGLGLVLSPLWFDVGPAEATYGKVLSLGYVQNERGATPRAVVQVGERKVNVRIFRADLCRVGDRIEVIRHKVMIGHRYTAGYRGCTRD